MRLIIYFGMPGLETEVFKAYMVSSGYQVKVVHSCSNAAAALDSNPDAIVVLAADQDPELVLRNAELLHSHLKFHGRMFVISPAQSIDLQISGAEVIPQPYRLSELVKRIRTLTPDSSVN